MSVQRFAQAGAQGQAEDRDGARNRPRKGYVAVPLLLAKVSSKVQQVLRGISRATGVREGAEDRKKRVGLHGGHLPVLRSGVRSDPPASAY